MTWLPVPLGRMSERPSGAPWNTIHSSPSPTLGAGVGASDGTALVGGLGSSAAAVGDSAWELAAGTAHPARMPVPRIPRMNRDASRPDGLAMIVPASAPSRCDRAAHL